VAGVAPVPTQSTKAIGIVVSVDTDYQMRPETEWGKVYVLDLG
jgi:hypothetical protein